MRKNLQRIVPYALTALLTLVAGCGTFTTHLVESCTRGEPDLKQFNAAYWKPGNSWRSGKIIVDYSVQEPQYPKQEKRDTSYWAELSIENLAYDEISHPQDGVTIHRHRLAPRRVSGYTQLPIVPLDEIRTQAGGRYVWDYLAQKRTDVVPLITAESNWFIIQDKTYKGRGYKRFCPTRSYIPLCEYPKLVVLYPLAIVGDIVTFPFMLIAPGWHD